VTRGRSHWWQPLGWALLVLLFLVPWTALSHPGSVSVVGADDLPAILCSSLNPAISLGPLGVPVGTTVATIPVGATPYFPAYDRGNGYVYVPNADSNDVSVVNGTAAVGSVNVGDGPLVAIYDGGNNYVYVANAYSDNVSVISGTTVVGSVTAGSHPQWGAYDSENGFVYIANAEGTNVTVISGTTVVGSVNVGAKPWSAGFDPGNGYVYVPNEASDNVSVLKGTTAVASVKVGSDPQFTAYDSRNGYVYVADAGSDTVSVISNTTVVRSIDVGTLPYSATFDSQNGYVYVPNAASYNVSVINGTTIVGSVNVGISPVQAIYDSGNGYIYVPTPGTVNVSVINGTTVIGSVSFASLYLAAEYGVYDPGNGYVYLSDYNADVVSAILIPPAYAVTFTETGLPSSTNWSVTLNGTTHTSSTGSIPFTEPNGSYDFSVGLAAGYGPKPSNGSLTVHGAHPPVSVAFTKVYLLTFNETGLPQGTDWSVALTGNTTAVILAASIVRSLSMLTRSSDFTATIQFYVSSGSFSYSASTRGYSSITGSVNVSAPGIAPVIVHFPSSSPPGPTILDYAVSGAVVVVAAIGLLVVLMRRRRGGAPPDSTLSPQPPGGGAPPARP
jgi:YVTN family beta-propeller protein